MDQILGATTMYSLPPTAPVRTVPEHSSFPLFHFLALAMTIYPQICQSQLIVSQRLLLRPLGKISLRDPSWVDPSQLLCHRLIITAAVIRTLSQQRQNAARRCYDSRLGYEEARRDFVVNCNLHILSTSLSTRRQISYQCIFITLALVVILTNFCEGSLMILC